MNAKPARPPIKKANLENEVILSVVFLYFVISSSLLLIHHLQPEDAVTLTSSPSPSHAGFFVGAAPGATIEPAADPAAIGALLERAGYREVRDLRRDADLWRATAVKNGQRWDLQIDPRPVIVATPAAAAAAR
jgi:hypothetical protein